MKNKIVGSSRLRERLSGLIREHILPHFPSVGDLDAAPLLLSGQPTEAKDKKVCATFPISVLHSKTFISETLKIHKRAEQNSTRMHTGTPEQLAQVLVCAPSSAVVSLGASLGPPTELQSFSCLAYPIY